MDKETFDRQARAHLERMKAEGQQRNHWPLYAMIALSVVLTVVVVLMETGVF